MRMIVERPFRYYNAALELAHRRRTAWRGVLIPVCLTLVAVIWAMFFRVFCWFHMLIYPQHQMAHFWGAGQVSFGNAVWGFLMLFAPAPAALVGGLMLGNALFWCIPQARRDFGIKTGPSKKTEFRRAMVLFFRIEVVALPLGLLLALFGSFCLDALR